MQSESASRDTPRHLAIECLNAGIDASNPARRIEDILTLDGTTLTINGDVYDLADYDDVLVVGGGNAAGIAAHSLEEVLGERIDRGAVVTDKPAPSEHVDMLPGDHPIPSDRAIEHTRTMLDVAGSTGEDDLVIGLITGGGSALMPALAPGITLSDMQELTENLLVSGAPIDEINVIRKHCSKLKGGQLAAVTAPATVIGLVFSDVVGNHLDVIASGPLSPDPTTYGDALDVVDRYEIDVPESIQTRLERGEAGEYAETPIESNPCFDSVTQYLLADGNTALDAAAKRAERSNYETLILSSRIRGEARECAKFHAGIAEECYYTQTPVEPPAVLLSGGETTVTIRGDGTGGPNQEFVLSTALELQIPATVASIDTDGIDGISEAAGAVATTDTATPVDEAKEALLNNDSGSFLDQRDAHIVTGPTGTNVNDLRVIVIPRDESI